MKRETLKKLAVIPVICSMMMTACGAANDSATSNAVTAKESAATAAPAETYAAAETEAAAKADMAGDAAVEEAAPAEYKAEPSLAAAPEKEGADGAVYEAAVEEEAYDEMYFASDDDSDSSPVTTIAGMYEEEAAAEEERERADDTNSQRQAGLLTAGEWNDNENWGFFTNLVNSGKITYPAYGIDPRFRTAVTVKDPQGAPVVNAKVTLVDGDTAMWTAVTDKEGVVYLFGKGDTLQITSMGTTKLYRFSPDGEPAETEQPAETTVTESTAEPESSGSVSVVEAVQIVLKKASAILIGTDDAPVITEPVQDDSITMAVVAENARQDRNQFISNEVEIVFDGSGQNYKDMQIMFIVDTTGSMSDELMFLQTEFSAIAQKVGTDNVTYSVNFYKDEGDVYVTRTNPFSDSVADLNRKLNSEVASGGGDTPEAVSEILMECMNSQEWKDDTVKLAFLIFDAPPHDDPRSLAVLEKAMRSASAQGIRVIPVVSSNSERETELFGRGLAIFTGGTYVFLTDDSGVGDSHLEPIIGTYEVESLYDLIVRLIEEYRQ